MFAAACSIAIDLVSPLTIRPYRMHSFWHGRIVVCNIILCRSLSTLYQQPQQKQCMSTYKHKSSVPVTCSQFLRAELGTQIAVSQEQASHRAEAMVGAMGTAPAGQGPGGGRGAEGGDNWQGDTHKYYTKPQHTSQKPNMFNESS